MSLRYPDIAIVGGCIVGLAHALAAAKRSLKVTTTFATLPDPCVLERWHVFYAKFPQQVEFNHHPEPGVTIVQNTNGLGMTLSFGLAEEILHTLDL